MGDGWSARRRSSTGCGTTTSVAGAGWVVGAGSSSPTSTTCAGRSTIPSRRSSTRCGAWGTLCAPPRPMTMGHKPRPRLRLWPRRWRHWSLRFRMVVATVALAAIALIVANVAGVALLRSTLIHQIDTQLEHQARASAKAKTSVPRPPRGGRHLPAESRQYRYNADGTLRYASPSSDNDQPRLGAFTALKARAGGAPFTVDGTEGDWRVKVSAVAGGQQYAVYAVSLDAIQVTEETLLL